MTRLLCAGYPTLGLILLILESASPTVKWLVTCLFRASVHSMKELKVWSLATTFLYSPANSGMSFLMILFEIYMAMVYLPPREKDVGSTATVVWLFVTSAIVNLVYLLLMLVFSTVTGNMMYEYQSSNGLWPLILVTISLRSLSDPNGSTSFWGMVMIPNKWYPVALCGFFFLINGMKILWDFVAAIIVGYAYFPLRLERLLISRASAGRLEQRTCSCLGGGRCTVLGASWVPAVSAASDFGRGEGQGSEDRSSIYATLSDFGRSGQQMAERAVQPGGPFAVFSGGGNRLGEGDAEAPSPAPSPGPGPAPAPAS